MVAVMFTKYREIFNALGGIIPKGDFMQVNYLGYNRDYSNIYVLLMMIEIIYLLSNLFMICLTKL
jgi:hypothetical protein